MLLHFPSCSFYLFPFILNVTVLSLGFLRVLYLNEEAEVQILRCPKPQKWETSFESQLLDTIANAFIPHARFVSVRISKHIIIIIIAVSLISL